MQGGELQVTRTRTYSTGEDGTMLELMMVVAEKR